MTNEMVCPDDKGIAAIQTLIVPVQGIPVMLDRDLASLYGVDVKRLNEQVSRNVERFPERFMHQLTMEEFENLKSQIATSSSDSPLSHLKSQIATSSWGGVRKPPRVFTEQGISIARDCLAKAKAAAALDLQGNFREKGSLEGTRNREPVLCRRESAGIGGSRRESTGIDRSREP